MAVRQAAAEVGDGGVVFGQLLLDRQRRAELGLRLRRLARLAQQRRRSWIVSARSRRASSMAPGAAASASWSARACR